MSMIDVSKRKREGGTEREREKGNKEKIMRMRER